MLLAVVLFSFGSAPAQAQPVRIQTAAALEHILEKVDPVVPAEAAAAKVGGVVIADVVVTTTGAVSSVTVLEGPAMLHSAATAALRRWKFKPFVHRGKPTTVQVILEVVFPDPIQEEEDRIFEAHRAARYECQRQLEADPQNAEPTCAEAVRRAEALPADRVHERSHAIADHADSLIKIGRVREAVAQLERVLALRMKASRSPDAETAGAHHVLALLHERLGERSKADSHFTEAVAMYTAAFEAWPAHRERHLSSLKDALEHYARLKREMGETDAASALEARAAALRPSAPAKPASRAAMTTRNVGNLRIVEPADSRLSEDDVRQIRAQVARTAQGRQPWLLENFGRQSDVNGRFWWRVEAFVEPDVTTSALKRGRIVMLLTTSSPSSDSAKRNVWETVQANFFYVQVAATGGAPALERAIRLLAGPNAPPMSTDDVLGVVSFMRTNARTAEGTPRLMSDIQPWPIAEINAFRASEIQVLLADPASEDRAQLVTLRREGRGWAIAEMNETRRPH